MNARRTLVLAASHAAAAALGFAGGIYVLPVLIAPPAPGAQDVKAVAAKARFTGEFRRDLKDSDALHWGEGRVAVAGDAVSLEGRLAPGPDYKLYLSPEFIETRADFRNVKPRMVRVGDVTTFENFVVAVPPGVDVAQYTTAIVWCEAFGQFITAARYR